jgi:hypothetical protein
MSPANAMAEELSGAMMLGWIVVAGTRKTTLVDAQ